MDEELVLTAQVGICKLPRRREGCASEVGEGKPEVGGANRKWVEAVLCCKA